MNLNEAQFCGAIKFKSRDKFYFQIKFPTENATEQNELIVYVSIKNVPKKTTGDEEVKINI